MSIVQLLRNAAPYASAAILATGVLVSLYDNYKSNKKPKQSNSNITDDVVKMMKPTSNMQFSNRSENRLYDSRNSRMERANFDETKLY